MKAPWIKFFPGDWLRGADLRLASVAARGLWIDLLCHMHEADPRGFLFVAGKPATTEQIARIVGVDCAVAESLLGELEALKVFSRDDSGCIFNRRMAREGEISEMRQMAGKQGGRGNHKAKRKQNESKPQSKTKAKPLETEKQNESTSTPARKSKPLASSSSFYVESLDSTRVRPVPESLESWDFRKAFDQWLLMRAEIRKPVKETAIGAQLGKLESMADRFGLDATIRAVLDSVANQWQGIFAPKPQAGCSRNGDLYSGLRDFLTEDHP